MEDGGAAGEGGSIINVSSQMGHVGAARRTVYCASKHGLVGLTLLRVKDLATAQRLAAEDPAVRAGRLKATVREWRVPVNIRIGRVELPIGLAAIRRLRR